jgi:eukaryotic-like serine/threonine-protein kinase
MKTERLIELIKSSGLLDERKFDAFLLQHSAAPNGQALADELIAARLLTPWQADMLLAGRQKDLFLGRYNLLSHLGNRWSSTIYLALEPFQQRLVAIKVLPASDAQNPKQLERFRFLATIGIGLNEPAIIKTYDLSQEGLIHFMVQEYVQGKSLAEHVAEQGPLTCRLAITYVSQMALGLQHLHRIGLLHRNLRPESLLLNEGSVKIVGFEHPMAGDLEYATHALRDDEVGHIADFMAPEHAEADHRADLYSLGCVLYFLLTGAPPFPHGTLTQRLVAHRRHRPPNLLRRQPHLSQVVVDVYEKLLAKNPAERFQSADEVHHALLKAFSHE